MKNSIKSFEPNEQFNKNMGMVNYAELNLIVAHDKLGLEYLPDQVMSAMKVMCKCLYLSDKNDRKKEMKDYNSLKNKLLRWRNENFEAQEGESLFEAIENENVDTTKDAQKLAQEILTNLMRFYEAPPRIYYVWLLRDWGIFDDEISKKARMWMADDCNYREDISPEWYEIY